MADPKNKYKVAKLLIDSDQIVFFYQIIDYVPKSTLARELNTSPTRFTRLIVNPFDFKLKELNIIAKCLQISLEKIIELIVLQEKNNGVPPTFQLKRKPKK